MQVTIEIDDGGKARTALPIRAIPYVCAWSYGAAPDDIVQTLAAPKIKKYYDLAIRLRHNELFAYQMDAHGRYEKIPPSQWERLVFQLDILTKKLQAADERKGVDYANYERWGKKAVLKLPDNVFIWLDEFQHWYSSTRPIDGDSADTEHSAPEDEDEDAGCLKKLDDTLCLMPIIPPKIENQLWRYAKDFEKQTAPAAKLGTATITVPAMNEAGLSKREKQIRAIEAEVELSGYDKLQIATGCKTTLRNKCKEKYVSLFGAGNDPFDDAWKAAIHSSPPRLRMAEHIKFAG